MRAMSPRRRAACAWAAALAALLACSPARPPLDHVLLIVIDTLRAGHLSCYGYDRPTSPHIDRLAREGVRFERATAQSSWTAPSMVSLFTGRHLAEERIRVPDDCASLPELFRERGYRTGAFVVNPLVHNEENGFRRGFERFEAHGRFQDIAEWIAASADRPTFTFVHWVDPHDPYGPEEDYHHFLREAGRVPDELARYFERVSEERGLGALEESVAAVGRAINGYDDDIRLVDSKVDILVRALRRSGQLERSVVVLASDHGEGLWRHANYPTAEPEPGPPSILTTHKMTHGNQLYEELLHVPLIVYAPGTAAGVVVREPVENVDVLPTLLELADIASPPGITGRSLVPLMRAGGQRTGAAADSFSLTRYVRSVRTAEGYKLILPTEEGRAAGIETELFDLRTDPHERVDLSAREPERVRELSGRIERRLAGGLRSAPGEWELSEENEAAMRALGYVD